MRFVWKIKTHTTFPQIIWLLKFPYLLSPQNLYHLHKLLSDTLQTNQNNFTWVAAKLFQMALEGKEVLEMNLRTLWTPSL